MTTFNPALQSREELLKAIQRSATSVKLKNGSTPSAMQAAFIRAYNRG